MAEMMESKLNKEQITVFLKEAQAVMAVVEICGISGRPKRAGFDERLNRRCSAGGDAKGPMPNHLIVSLM
jgi:hypothetical protein